MERRNRLLEELGARRFRGRTNGPLTLHLSRSGALENAGIALHPIYGFAWLPGTGVKGMVRAWAETVWKPAQSDRTGAEERTGADERIQVAFGTGSRAGRIAFHDAWPTEWPRLEADIANTHHPKYYGGEDDPGDWEDPKPIHFLAVAPGTGFDFAISDRTPTDDGLVELAMEWLRSALAHAGAGAKTAAGYGRIVPVEGPRPPAPARIERREHELELVTPAFLAGANQGKQDCDLRPATLRGLLRWWWRTMHAGRLGRRHLLELETAIWGNAETGSAVSIAVEALGNDEPEHYRLRHGDKPDFADRNDLELPGGGRDKKVTQGLFYLSYGMDEGRDDRRSRWFRGPGARWRLTLTARDGRWRPLPERPVCRIPERPVCRIPGRLVMEQAEAALWLLTRFGGAGSRSRKGFGSFTEVEVQSVRSVEECLASAKKLRGECGLDDAGKADAPSLKASLTTKSVPTPWRNPWTALDQVGYVFQSFAKSGLQDRERMALGLPRRVGGHPLSGPKGKRHASPAHWSFSRRSDGTLTVRVIAFPAARLPDERTSRKVLSRLLHHAEQDLAERIRDKPGIGQRKPKAARDTGSRREADSSGLPEAGARVPAVLLQKRTKKSGWMAQTGAGFEGSIFNSGEVPSDARPGQEVELIVKSSSRQGLQFEWPSPAVEGRLAARRKKPGKPRGKDRSRGGPRPRR